MALEIVVSGEVALAEVPVNTQGVETVAREAAGMAAAVDRAAAFGRGAGSEFFSP